MKRASNESQNNGSNDEKNKVIEDEKRNDENKYN